MLESDNHISGTGITRPDSLHQQISNSVLMYLDQFFFFFSLSAYYFRLDYGLNS